MISASKLSIVVKILGAFVIVVSLVLNGIGVITLAMSEVLLGVGGLELLVIPIDISKIKTAGKGDK